MMLKVTLLYNSIAKKTAFLEVLRIKNTHKDKMLPLWVFLFYICNFRHFKSFFFKSGNNSF